MCNAAILTSNYSMLRATLSQRQCGASSQAILRRFDDLPRHCLHCVLRCPFRVVHLEPSEVADIPDVVHSAVFLVEAPVHSFAGDILAQVNSFQNRAIGVGAASYIVNFTRSRRFENRPEGSREIVEHLFFITENPIGRVVRCASCEIGEKAKKAVQLSSGMRRPGMAATAETSGFETEVAAVFLLQ